VLVTYASAIPLLAGSLWLWKPAALFSLISSNLKMWTLVMITYPLVSVFPQYNGPGALARSRPVQQRTNTSCHLAMPTRGFTAVLRCSGAHLQGSPLNCKSVFIASLDLCGACARQHAAGGGLRSACVRNVLAAENITTRSARSVDLSFRLLQVSVAIVTKTKNPAYHSVSRVWKSCYRLLRTCLPGVCANYPWDPVPAGQ